MQTPTERALSLKEFSQKHGICRGTVYNQAHAGKLVLTKIGARTIVRPEHERAWLESLPTSTAA